MPPGRNRLAEMSGQVGCPLFAGTAGLPMDSTGARTVASAPGPIRNCAMPGTVAAQEVIAERGLENLSLDDVALDQIIPVVGTDADALASLAG